jgi:hypothetical protein
MEKMELIVNRNLINTLFLFLLFPLLVFGQNINRNLEVPFSYKGYSKVKLTRDSANKLLINDLTKGIYFPMNRPSCQNDVGIFLFKVDFRGRVSTNDIYWNGTLLDSIRTDIINNIKKSTGKYYKPSSKIISKNHWYIFEYNSLGFDLDCGGDVYLKEQLKQSKVAWSYYSIVKKMVNNISGLKSNVTILMSTSNTEAEKRGLLKPTANLKL